MKLFHSLDVITSSFEVISNEFRRIFSVLFVPLPFDFHSSTWTENCRKRSKSRVRNTLSIITEFDMDVYLPLNCRFFLSLLYNFLWWKCGCAMDVCMIHCIIVLFHMKMYVRWLGQTTFEPKTYPSTCRFLLHTHTHTKQPYTTSPSNNILKLIAIYVSYNITQHIIMWSNIYMLLRGNFKQMRWRQRLRRRPRQFLSETCIHSLKIYARNKTKQKEKQNNNSTNTNSSSPSSGSSSSGSNNCHIYRTRTQTVDVDNENESISRMQASKESFRK